MSDPVRGKLNRVRFLGKSDSIVLTVKMGGGGRGERVGREHLQSTEKGIFFKGKSNGNVSS